MFKQGVKDMDALGTGATETPECGWMGEIIPLFLGLSYFPQAIHAGS